MKLWLIVYIALLTAVPVIAQEADEPQDQGTEEQAPAELEGPEQPKPGPHNFGAKGPWCVAPDFQLFGLAQDSLTGQWAWYVSGNVMFLHVTTPLKKPSVRLLGVGYGIVMFDSIVRRSTLIFTLIPIKVGSFAFGITPYKVSRFFDDDYTGQRPDSGVLFTVTVH